MVHTVKTFIESNNINLLKINTEIMKQKFISPTLHRKNNTDIFSKNSTEKTNAQNTQPASHTINNTRKKIRLVFLDANSGSDLIGFYDAKQSSYFGLTSAQIFSDYFTTEYYNKNTLYKRNEVIFVLHNVYVKKNDYMKNLPRYQDLMGKGYKVVWWVFTEYPPGGTSWIFQESNIPIFYIPHWFWFRELEPYYNLLSYKKGNGLIYHTANYPRKQTFRKLALMPIGRHRRHRQLLLDKLGALKEKMIYSDQSQGKDLPRDIDYETLSNPYYKLMPGSETETRVNDRYFNPAWYNDTIFSIVAETVFQRETFPTIPSNINLYHDDPIFLTEKTFKPIMYRHPFVIWGQTGSLAYLKYLGFETFENLFDETYDTMTNELLKLSRLCNTIEEFTKNVYNMKHNPSNARPSITGTGVYTYDKITEGKIIHNYNWFFNGEVVKNRLYNDLVVPMCEFLEKN